MVVLEIKIKNRLAIFWRYVGYFIGYWLLSHWKCTRKLGQQNGFWSAKCWNWLEMISGRLLFLVLGWTDSQADRQTDTQTDRQAHRHTQTQTQTHTHTHIDVADKSNFKKPELVHPLFSQGAPGLTKIHLYYIHTLYRSDFPSDSHLSCLLYTCIMWHGNNSSYIEYE